MVEIILSCFCFLAVGWTCLQQIRHLKIGFLEFYLFRKTKLNRSNNKKKIKRKLKENNRLQFDLENAHNKLHYNENDFYSLHTYMEFHNGLRTKFFASFFFGFVFISFTIETILEFNLWTTFHVSAKHWTMNGGVIHTTEYVVHFETTHYYCNKYIRCNSMIMIEGNFLKFLVKIISHKITNELSYRDFTVRRTHNTAQQKKTRRGKLNERMNIRCDSGWSETIFKQFDRNQGFSLSFFHSSFLRRRGSSRSQTLQVIFL